MASGNIGIDIPDPLAKLTVNGAMIRRLAVATGLGPNDGTDEGQISSRVLSFTKVYADTAVRVFYCDNLRINTQNAACRWEIRFNGQAPPGGAIFQDKYSNITGAVSSNQHEPATIIGYATGLAAGTYTIEVWVGPVPGYPVNDAYTGWNNSRWTLEAQEVWI
jgi:hypothetical protein